CGQPQFIDISLQDLGKDMQKAFSLTAPTAATVDEMARLVLEVLSRGGTTSRWLLVYDNADEIGAVEPFLPPGGGHVLITSRNTAWAEQTRSLSVELFTREESISHLLQIVPALDPEVADRVADVLGDLPLAVAISAAWLADTSYSISEYLRRLEAGAPRA